MRPRSRSPTSSTPTERARSSRPTPARRPRRQGALAGRQPERAARPGADRQRLGAQAQHVGHVGRRREVGLGLAGSGSGSGSGGSGSGGGSGGPAAVSRPPTASARPSRGCSRLMKRAIKTHMGDFAAIIVLLVLSVVVAGYVLSHERLPLPVHRLLAVHAQRRVLDRPGRHPRAGPVGPHLRRAGRRDRQRLAQERRGDRADAASTTSTSNLIHTNATALLRPKTGLKDMFIELQPGQQVGPGGQAGVDAAGVQHAARRRRRRDPLLAGRRHPQLPPAAGQRRRPGPAGQGRLRAGPGVRALRAHPPGPGPPQQGRRRPRPRPAPARQLAAAPQHLAQPQPEPDRAPRRRQLHRVPGLRLPGHQHQRAPSATCRARWPRPPTRSTRSRRSPTCWARRPRNLLPAAKALPAANAAVTALAKPSAPIVQNQIRPFVVAARPLVRNLKPAAENLAAGDAQPDQDLRRRQALRQHAGLQPGRHRARLPVVAGVA